MSPRKGGSSVNKVKKAKTSNASSRINRKAKLSDENRQLDNVSHLVTQATALLKSIPLDLDKVKIIIDKALKILKDLVNESDTRDNIDGYQSPPRLHFNNLPDLCLMSIFRQIDLQEMIPLRAICSRWSKVIRAVCSQKQSLKLYENNQLHHYRQYLNVLDSHQRARMEQVDSLSIRYDNIFARYCFAHFLRTLFPNLKHLIVVKGRIYFEDLILLKKWTALCGLTVCAKHVMTDQNSNLNQQFCEVINSLGQLIRLDLIFDDICELKVPKLASTLVRLERFSLRAHGRLELIYSRIGPNCTHLQLGNFSLTDDYKYENKIDLAILRASLALNPNLAGNITHLAITEFKLNIDMLSYIYRNFVKLQFLCIESFDNPGGSQCALEYVLNQDISNLKQLRELKISKIQFDLDYRYLPFPLTALRKMKILHLIQTDHDQPFACVDVYDWGKKLSTLFPNLEELTIYEQIKRFQFDQFTEQLKGYLYLFPKLRKRNFKNSHAFFDNKNIDFCISKK